VMLFILLITVSLIAWLIAYPLFKQKMYGELIVTMGITILALAVSLIQLYKLPIINPTDVLGIIFKPVVSFVGNLLK